MTTDPSSPSTAQCPATPSRKRILIVEDESIVARDIQDCLDSLGYWVVGTATSGEDAIQQAMTLNPDLILMDIRLRGTMDGIEAAEHIWQQQQIPFIYATGYSDRSTLDRAKTTTPFGYILKPIEERELAVAIETALERYRLQQEIQSREQWLFTILRDIGDGILVLDAEEKVRFMNDLAQELTGWTLQEALGQPATEVFCLRDEHTRSRVDPFTDVLQHGSVTRIQQPILLMHRSGTAIPIGDSIAPLRDESGQIKGIVVVFRDVTDRRLAEERNLAIERARQLENRMMELQRLNQLKDNFLNTVSHELRTPLSNIKMAIQMLEVALSQEGMLDLSAYPFADRLNRYLGILQDQCDQELDLVNTLLDLQRLDAEVYPLEPNPIELQNWLPYVVESFRERTDAQQQKLSAAISPDLPFLVSDVHSLTRVLNELLNNACKYTPSGEHISVSTCLPSPGILELQIRNTGIEIPPDALPQVFDQFYRVPGTKQRQVGTGLGLTLVKQLVSYLGGAIRAESGAGQTCFIITLPLQFMPPISPSSPPKTS